MIKVEELWEGVEYDTKEHTIKKIAELFLNAMRDWPNSYENILSYINEFKKYFGNPLSIKNIASVKFDKNNAWQIEAGSSLIEMLEIAKLYLPHDDFDNIVQIVFDYYKSK